MKLKKYLFVLIILTCFSISSKAQKIKHAVYFNSGLQLGNYNYGGLDYGLNYINNNKYSINIGTYQLSRNASNVPENYHKASFSFDYPYDFMNVYYFSFGRIIPLNPSGKIRLNLSAGMALSESYSPTNWTYLGYSGWFGTNYYFDYQLRQESVNFMINPKIEFPFSRFFGLYISPTMLISKDYSYLGIAAGLNLGILR